jgi:hypothetical protein
MKTGKQAFMPILKRSLVVLLVSLALLSCAGCNRRAPTTTAPSSAAYTDGFEVVVFDLKNGASANTRSVTLKDAEAAIAAGTRALVPGEDPTSIRQQLQSSGKADLVQMSVQALDGGKQRVRVSFHESKRTYVYEYDVDGAQIRPVRSEYHDLAGAKVVRYGTP